MKYNKLIFDKDTKINDLIKQIESLKSINSGLELKMKNILLDPENQNTNKFNQLSKAKIDEFVEQLLNDTDVNIKYLPDFVERAIYKNVLNLIMALLNNVFNTVSVKFLGHNLTFNVLPDMVTDTVTDTVPNTVPETEKKDKNIMVISDKELENFLYSDNQQFKIDVQELDAILNP